MATNLNHQEVECSSCSLLRSNLSDVMKRLGDHDMLVRMLDLTTKQRDCLQKQLCAATESESSSKRECAAMQVRRLLFLRNLHCTSVFLFIPPSPPPQHYQQECRHLRLQLQSQKVRSLLFVHALYYALFDSI
jgi:hypothetical protein